MEILQTTAKMQQTQMPMSKSSGAEMQSAQMQKVQTNESRPSESANGQKISQADYQEQMEDLVMKLNRSLNPFNTSLRFGFDNSSDEFYVSVIDTKDNSMLRRFPAEEAEQILPKMQEINGLLFDQSV